MEGRQAGKQEGRREGRKAVWPPNISSSLTPYMFSYYLSYLAITLNIMNDNKLATVNLEFCGNCFFFYSMMNLGSAVP